MKSIIALLGFFSCQLQALNLEAALDVESELSAAVESQFGGNTLIPIESPIDLPEQKVCEIWSDTDIWLPTLPEQAFDFCLFQKYRCPQRFEIIAQQILELETCGWMYYNPVHKNEYWVPCSVRGLVCDDFDYESH